MKWLRLIFKNFWKFTTALFFVIILLQRMCSGPEINCPEIEVTKLPPVTIKYETQSYIPVVIPEYRDTGSVKWRTVYEQQKLDTAKIMEMYRSYFAEKRYRDEILNDTNGKVIITDLIRENKIINRTVEKEFYPHTYIITKIEYPEARRKVLVGLGVGGWVDKFGVSGRLMYIDKKNHPYTISYNPVLRYAEIGTYWKISFRGKNRRNPP